ncbi:arylsulfatase A-like enzyme [Ereboglobus sp. PH5-10]|uniref:sulfatase-like hydrolase/transferase n=1 Tax=Ereboglobus sp. PH5-10 TaxID=2940629 RepID=UPI002406B13C|nr:sulfatase-like hydrolase/transferase [Ereboglobus sp. PH5-10]MDF9826621.1 arylsulfatase A-like enzyme [Ereboglobus sp. PH5-10]
MSRPPDILWIVTTQWRAQAFAFAGDPNLRAPSRTPRLDALAREPGTINFAQAVTPHPFGPFARAAMLTGIPSPENGVRDYYDPLPASSRTIAHALRERGYATAFFGKWHLSKRDPRAPLVGETHARAIVPPGARGGFDFWEGFESGFLLNDPWLHGTRLPEPRQFRGYQGGVLCERALEYFCGRETARENPARAPMFCIVSLETPHPPYDAPAANAVAPNPEQLILPANVPAGSEAESKARRELAGYYAHIEATDTAVGRLIAGARAKNPGALIVFTSAHGDMHGAHGLFRKGWPHEESVRVPLLVNHPTLAPESILSNAAVSLIDLPAMTLSLAEETTRSAFGKNSPGSPRLDFTHALISMPSVVRLPRQCERAWRGVRTPARKLILNEDGSPWLFFDLENDPLEMRNLVGEPSRMNEIAALTPLISG